MTHHFFSTENIEGVTIVTPHGPKFDLDSQDGLVELVESGQTNLVLDLTHVLLLSSKGLAVIFGLKKRLDTAGGRLRLCCAQDEVAHMLHVTHMDGFLDISRTLAEALSGS